MAVVDLEKDLVLAKEIGGAMEKAVNARRGEVLGFVIVLHSANSGALMVAHAADSGPLGDMVRKVNEMVDAVIKAVGAEEPLFRGSLDNIGKPGAD